MALFDSIFGTEFYLREDSIGANDQEDDDQDQYSMGDDQQGDDNNQNQGNEPKAQNDDQGDQYSMSDTDQQEQGGDNNPSETAGDDNDDDQGDQYAMGDADQQGDDNQNQDGNNPSETAEDDNDDDQGDQYAMGDSDSGDDNDYQGDDNSDQSSTTQDTSSDDPNSQLKELEKSIFDQLSHEQQKVKTKELKDLYIATYNKCQKIIAMVSEVDKIPSRARIYDYVINSLTDLQKYIRDYLDDLFESKTYIENMTELQKYLVVLDTVNGVFEEMRKSAEDADK